MRRLLKAAAACLAFTVAAPAPAAAQEYRGFWVDTFNTALNRHEDVVAVVNNAVTSNANALFVQVRRRGDSWYLNSLEPAPDPDRIVEKFAPGFDPLQDLIAEAHLRGIEVHAFVIASAIWHKNPNFLPDRFVGPPTSPDHAFNQHSGHNGIRGAAGAITDLGPNNWLTRTLLPDDARTRIGFQGHRFGNDFWIDFGHPDAAAYTVDVLMHLVRNYDIDGLHLDRIRYPEIEISGQRPSTGTSIGYNSTSVARFHRRHGLPPGSPMPAQGNPQWSQWRRDQVTNVVRRVYLNAIAIKPHLKISAALIAFGGAPAPGAWTTSAAAEAYWRVFQDWRAWLEEGIIDLAIPMNYKREHLAAQQAQFNTWLEFSRNHQYGRATLMGQGAFLNGIEGTLRQVRRSLEPSATTGNKLGGVVFFSMAGPYAVPRDHVAHLEEFASGLTTGRSVDGGTLYEDPVANPVPVFSSTAPVPVHPWKIDPQVGHLKGFVQDESGAVVDTGAITIQRQETDAPAIGRTVVTNATDGGGFYGGVDLAPGTYRVTVTPVGAEPFTSCPAAVTKGAVTTLDVTVDRAAPTTTITADPQEIWPPNGRQVVVTVAGDAADVGTGVNSVTFRVIDEYGQVQPPVDAELAFGAASRSWQRTIALEASRRGEDRNGRTYTIEATVTDRACNSRVFATTVVVGHDQRRGQ